MDQTKRHFAKDLQEGLLGVNFDKTERADINTKAADAETAAEDEVWGGYRFVVFAGFQNPDGGRSFREYKKIKMVTRTFLNSWN